MESRNEYRRVDIIYQKCTFILIQSILCCVCNIIVSMITTSRVILVDISSTYSIMFGYFWLGLTAYLAIYSLNFFYYNLLCDCYLVLNREMSITIDPIKRIKARPGIMVEQWGTCINAFRPRQNGRNFPDDISNTFSWIKMYELWLLSHWNFFLWVLSTIFLRLPTHICVTQPQWV